MNMTPEHREFIRADLLFAEKDIKLNRRALEEWIEGERAQLQTHLCECSQLLKKEEEKERKMVKYLERERKLSEKQEKEREMELKQLEMEMRKCFLDGEK